MGGTAVVMIAMDIQKEFGFAQNWPKGSALCVLLVLLAGGLSLALLSASTSTRSSGGSDPASVHGRGTAFVSRA